MRLVRSTSASYMEETDMTDIVERLRSRAWEARHHRKYREEAADEIERLRAENAERYHRLRDLSDILAPFVALLQPHNDKGPDDTPIFGINDAKITLGDLRRARAVFNAVKEKK